MLQPFHLQNCFFVRKHNPKFVFKQTFHSLYQLNCNILVRACNNAKLTISIIVIANSKPGHESYIN